MSKELWGSVGGSSYRGANEEFANGQVVTYMSGNWQIGQFDKTIGEDFDWIVVPQPCGIAGCSGMPGGAAMVAMKDTAHPEEVSRVMEYLASEAVLGEFYGKSLFTPAHKALSERGIDYDTDSTLVIDALNQSAKNSLKVMKTAFELQAHVHNRIMFNAMISRLGQAVVGELTLERAFQRIEEDAKKQIAEKTK